MGTAMLHARGGLEHQATTAGRGEVLAHYRHLREIGKQHHCKVMGFVSRDAILQQARRLGMAAGRTILAESPDELTLALDLAIYTAPAGRSRAIDRYARSTPFPQGSEAALLLAAMCGARFAIIAVQRQHPVAGLLVTDIFRQTDLWLLDEGLERSLPTGAMFATRYYTPADFAMTAGIGVPIDLDFLEAAILMVPQLQHMSLVEALGDRRFAEAIYRAAMTSGLMEEVSFQDPDGDAA